MSFYSGYECDKCGVSYQSEGMSAHEVYSITHLRRMAKNYGWSVGKEKLLCDACRRQKKTDRSPANQSKKR